MTQTTLRSLLLTMRRAAWVLSNSNKASSKIWKSSSSVQLVLLITRIGEVFFGSTVPVTSLYTVKSVSSFAKHSICEYWLWSFVRKWCLSNKDDFWKKEYGLSYKTIALQKETLCYSEYFLKACFTYSLLMCLFRSRFIASETQKSKSDSFPKLNSRNRYNLTKGWVSPKARARIE